jgi:glycerol-3-phosphate acyltransferase PlsY
MKREGQQDTTVRCLLLTSVSTCFGHHYVHLQENKGPVTAFGVLFWLCWMWLVAVVGRCFAGCQQRSRIISTEGTSLRQMFGYIAARHGLIKTIFCFAFLFNT